MNLDSLNRSIRSLEKKRILSKLTKSESRRYKDLKKEREELRKKSSYFLKKNEKFSQLSNEQRSVSLKLNNLKKRLDKSEKIKDQVALSRKIEKLEWHKIKIQEKKFKNSKKFVKISYARRDLVQKTKLIYKILSSEKDMKGIDKTKQRELFVKVIDIQEEIEALSDFINMPVVDIVPDGIIKSSDLIKYEGDIAMAKDTEEDIVGIWELKPTIDKKLDDNPNDFDFIEVFFPNGRFYQIDLTLDSYSIEWESVSTEFYNEIDNSRQVKKLGTPTAYIIYNFSERKITVSSNYTFK